MILVRDVFQLQFGKAKDAVTLMKEGMALASKEGYGPARLLTDLSGPYYTLVLETTYGSLSDFDTAMNGMGKSPAWGKWYKTFTPLVQSGRREIFTIVG